VKRLKSRDEKPPWHLRRTGFPEAWRLAAARLRTGSPVRIAVLDSGVDLLHPALAGMLGSGINLINQGDLPLDEHGHGTHVTGIIASAAGAWWRPEKLPPIKIYPVKIFDHSGYGSISNIVRGLEWCVTQGMDLVNLSFGTDQKIVDALEQAVLAVEKASILLVGAAGNDGRQGDVDFPGRLPGVLAVSSSTRSDKLARYSSAGPEVDLIAPGSSVLSLALGGGYVRMSGTSMAAPHVTAAAAILLGLEPHLKPEGVRRALRQSAEWLPWLKPEAQGSGLLRADRLLRSRST